MHRKQIVTALQVLVAVVVLGVVLWNVPYRDVARSREGAAAASFTGTVVGPAGPRPWEAPSVQLRLDDGSDRTVLQSEYEVKPGLPTLYRHLSLLPYLGGAALLLFGAYLASVRWWLLTRVLKIPFSVGAALKWSFVGFFFNNVVPGLIGGDLPKMYFVARDAPHKAHAVLTVIVDRLLGLLGLAIVACAAFLVDFERYAREPALAWMKWLLFGVLFGLAAGLVVVGSRRVRRALFPKERLARIPGGKLLEAVDEAAALFRTSPGTVGAALALSIGNHILSMVAWWLFAKALGGTLALGATFVVVPIVQIIKSVPIAPSGWGIGEAAFAVLLPLYQESATMGVALSITYQLTYLIFSLAGGFILLTSREKVSAEEMQHSVEAAESH